MPVGFPEFVENPENRCPVLEPSNIRTLGL